LNEDTYSVQMLDDKERLVSLTKSDLKEYEILTRPASSWSDGRSSR
jgi:hypothetical protein